MHAYKPLKISVRLFFKITLLWAVKGPRPAGSSVRCYACSDSPYLFQETGLDHTTSLDA